MLCLRGSHTKKNCRKQIKCFKCKAEGHHAAFCNPLQKQTQSYATYDNSKEDSSTNLVKSNTSILLQTAHAIATDEKEKQCCILKILLDPGSQQTFITQRIIDELKLKPLRELNMGVSGFLSHRAGEMKLKEYEIRLLPMNSKENHLIKVLSVPRICSKIKGQNLNCVLKKLNFIRDFPLANVDILIGADLHWQFVTGEMKRSESCNLVAINSIFGWVISGPNECVKGDHNLTVCTSAAHVLKIGCNETETAYLNNKIQIFWDLDEIGISNKELSVYEKFKNNITLLEGRYSVRLPIKEYHPVLPDNYPILPDNYDLSLKLLQSLKMRLAKDEMLLQKYDQIFQDQINAGMIEEVNTEGLVGNVTYLPRKEVLRNESTTTKVRIVCDASAKLKTEVSLNDILYTGPCLNP